MASEYFGKDLEAMSFATNYHRWIADEFAPYLGECVAEVGAGTGNFSDFLLQRGAKRVFAFEPSSNMYPHLERKYAGDERLTAHNALFGDWRQKFPTFFDSVLYVNVLEHIERDLDELRMVRETLKPGGHLLIFVPALQWLYCDLDRDFGHFRRYRRKGLRSTVEAAGFDVKHAKYFDVAGIIPWYVAFVLLKQKLSGGNVSAYDRLVVPVARVIEQLIPPPIGKNILLIAQKNA